MELDFNTLRAASQYVNNHLSRYPGLSWPNFVYDDLLPEDCYTPLRNGSADGVKLIIGTNKDETTFFNLFHKCVRSISELKRILENNNWSEKYDAIEDFYFQNKNKNRSCLDFFTDYLFLLGNLELANIQSQHSSI